MNAQGARVHDGILNSYSAIIEAFINGDPSESIRKEIERNLAEPVRLVPRA